MVVHGKRAARTNCRPSHLRQRFRGQPYVLHRPIVPPGPTADKAGSHTAAHAAAPWPGPEEIGSILRPMVISDDHAPAAPAGPAMGILLKGIGAGAVLGTACGAFLASGPDGAVLLPIGVLFGLAAGITLGFLCGMAGLGLHDLAERYVPVLRTAAAAVGAAATVLVSAAAVLAPATDVPMALRDVWLVLVLASAAAVLAAWLTRPLRSMR